MGSRKYEGNNALDRFRTENDPHLATALNLQALPEDGRRVADSPGFSAVSGSAMQLRCRQN